MRVKFCGKNAGTGVKIIKELKQDLAQNINESSSNSSFEFINND